MCLLVTVDLWWCFVSCVLGLGPVCYCLVHSYHLVDKSKSWPEARAHCREHYTDLATIDDIKDMDRQLILEFTDLIDNLMFYCYCYVSVLCSILSRCSATSKKTGGKRSFIGCRADTHWWFLMHLAIYSNKVCFVNLINQLEFLDQRSFSASLFFEHCTQFSTSWFWRILEALYLFLMFCNMSQLLWRYKCRKICQ